MTPTPATLDALDDKARKATPGPWITDLDCFDGEPPEIEATVSDGDSTMLLTFPTDVLNDGAEGRWERARATQEAKDAAFIAACSPDVVLALTNALREAWAKIEIGERMAQALTPFAAVKDDSPEIPDHTPAMFPCRVGQVRTATRVLAEWKARP